MMKWTDRRIHTCLIALDADERLDSVPDGDLHRLCKAIRDDMQQQLDGLKTAQEHPLYQDNIMQLEREVERLRAACTQALDHLEWISEDAPEDWSVAAVMTELREALRESQHA